MRQNRSKASYQANRRLKLPALKPPPQLSLLREYPYVFLAVLLAVAAFGGKVAGLSLWDSFILGAWLVSLAFFGWQLWRYLRYRANPEAAAKREAEKKSFLTAKAREMRGQGDARPAPKPPAPANPKIAAVPRKPAQRVVIRKPGMNVKPQPQTDDTPKT